MNYEPKIKKEDLIDGAYYTGKCRNATVARWNAEHNVFLHWRNKFVWFVEEIKCPEDEDVYDVFVTEAIIDVCDLDEDKIIDFDKHIFY